MIRKGLYVRSIPSKKPGTTPETERITQKYFLLVMLLQFDLKIQFINE